MRWSWRNLRAHVAYTTTCGLCPIFLSRAILLSIHWPPRKERLASVGNPKQQTWIGVIATGDLVFFQSNEQHLRKSEQKHYLFQNTNMHTRTILVELLFKSWRLKQTYPWLFENNAELQRFWPLEYYQAHIPLTCICIILKSHCISENFHRSWTTLQCPCAIEKMISCARDNFICTRNSAKECMIRAFACEITHEKLSLWTRFIIK